MPPSTTRLIQVISVWREPPPYLSITLGTLAYYAGQCSADLCVVTEIPASLQYELPGGHPKFLLYDNMQWFLRSDYSTCMFIDDDILVRRNAPDLFVGVETDQIHIADSYNLGQRRFESAAIHSPDSPDPALRRAGYQYNTGLIVLGRGAATKFLEVARPPYKTGAIEQDQCNYFILRCGAEIVDYPNERLVHTRPELGGSFAHFIGDRKTERIVEHLLEHGEHYSVLSPLEVEERGTARTPSPTSSGSSTS